MVNMIKHEKNINRKTAALILAAGEGSRMGGRAKCLIKIDREPLILGQLRTLRAAGIEQITIVTGFYREQIEAVLEAALAQDTALHLIRNPAPELGQQGSVDLGLKHLQADPELVLIALADQPLIDAKDIGELLDAFEARPLHTEILYPVVGGQRGNPVLMSGACVRNFLTEHSHLTCRQFIDQQASSVYRYLTSNDHFITDLDTEEDLAAVRKKTGLDITL